MTRRAPIRSRLLLAVVATVGVVTMTIGARVIAAGASAAPIDQTVVDFAEVQAGDFVFEADPTDPSRGIFRVTTTEPMICAIVWGETEAFGHFNNSLAMNGTGLIQHDVYLPGTIAGETYFFRVQGSTADGTLYRSSTGTFTIAPATNPPATIPSADGGAPEATVEHGPNLTLGATVTDVSSEFDASFAATNAVDGDGNTEWSSAGDGDDAFVEIDLGSPQAIAGVELITRSMLDGTAITETFGVSIDGESFGPFPAATPANRHVAVIEATGQVVRFDVDTSTGGNVGAVEVAVYGR